MYSVDYCTMHKESVMEVMMDSKTFMCCYWEAELGRKPTLMADGRTRERTNRVGFSYCVVRDAAVLVLFWQFWLCFWRDMFIHVRKYITQKAEKKASAPLEEVARREYRVRSTDVYRGRFFEILIFTLLELLSKANDWRNTIGFSIKIFIHKQLRP